MGSPTLAVDTRISPSEVVMIKQDQLKEPKLNMESVQITDFSSEQNDGYGSEEWCDDGSLGDDFNERLKLTSDLEKLHTMGYRDGLTAGNEAIAQEGFNEGFKQSVLSGQKWGLVRGVSSALACLPDGLKEKLVKEVEARAKFHNFYESVHSVSRKDSLKFFHDEILAGESDEPAKSLEGISVVARPSKLNGYFTELGFLLKTSTIQLTVEESSIHDLNQTLINKMVYDALVWCSLNGLVVGDKSVKKSGAIPGVGIVHAPFALLPRSFPESHWQQACELAPIFNELVDRVSLDGKFLQDSLSRTKGVDAFTSRLLDIHLKMLELRKKDEIRLGLHRSDYMLDDHSKNLLQIELNTISSSFAGLSCLVSKLHKNLLDCYGENIGLDSKKVPQNTSISGFADALAHTWREYNNSRAVIMFVVQNEERNMYDQHWLSNTLKENYGVKTIRRTLAEIYADGEILPDGTLAVRGQAVSVVYFRAGYAPSDYPSESEWKARLLIEQSSSVKCPSISYHLAGTKKIQQELAKPDVLERFFNDKDDIARLRKCFAELWSLDDSSVVNDAIKRSELFVLKPQREGGGNNIYGQSISETLLKLQNEGSAEYAAYILMQRIFPTVSAAFLVREGICHREHAISELGIYGAYLRNGAKVIINEQCGYLMRTKVSSSNEGGVAAGFAVLDSVYLT